MDIFSAIVLSFVPLLVITGMLAGFNLKPIHVLSLILSLTAVVLYCMIIFGESSLVPYVASLPASALAFYVHKPSSIWDKLFKVLYIVVFINSLIQIFA